jgi:uncharacterized RDD family membrane protein YckC
LEEVQEKWICGFWSRIGALFIDTLLLGALGFVLGLFLESIFVQLGGWGRVIGFITLITYFGVMNSSIANGQTFGKKLLKIRVVDDSNRTISLPKSVLRYSFLAVPFSLNGAQFTGEALVTILMYPLSLVVFGGLFSISYLYIFNRNTRQSIHDLVVGTFVVNAEASKESLAPVWKPHLIVVAGLLVVAAILPVFTSDLAQSAPFKGLMVTQEAIARNSLVKYASISEGWTTINSSDSVSKTTTYVKAQVFIYNNAIDNPILAESLAKTIVSSYPESLNKNTILITLKYGYDIGIWSHWNSHTHSFNPAQVEALN